MTDGIVQEVFNLRINSRKIKPIEREILECMKQELIEKIKLSSKFMTNEGEHGYAILSIPIYQLIGALDK